MITLRFLLELITILLLQYTATTGVLIPQFDPDTKLLFLAGKGTNKIFLQELQQKQPVISDGESRF